MFNKMLTLLSIALLLAAGRRIKLSDMKLCVNDLSYSKFVSGTKKKLCYEGKKLHCIDDLREDQLNTITHLSFSGNFLTDFYRLTQLKSTTLLSLNLSNNHISTIIDKDFEQLCNNFPCLQEINLKRNPLCSSEIAKIVDLCKKNNIKIIFESLDSSSSNEENSSSEEYDLPLFL